MSFLKPVFSTLATFVLLAGSTLAADAVATGKIKAVNAEKKEIVLTDSAGKDWTIKLGDNLMINRGGKESKSDLNVGDGVCVSYDKGAFNWTANYILVHEGETKDSRLVHGSIKHYDVDKKELTFTDHAAKDWSFPMGKANVRLNRESSKIGDVMIGDHALVIVETVGDVTSLKCLMIDRK